jgi:hypothetical protein
MAMRIDRLINYTRGSGSVIGVEILGVDGDVQFVGKALLKAFKKRSNSLWVYEVYS